MENIVFDIGNSRVKMATFSGRELVRQDSFAFSPNEIRKNISSSAKVIISSVINDQLTEALKDFKNIVFLDYRTKIPIVNKYLTPETLGNDRLANAVALNSLAKTKKALAIDCGTCLKMDLVIQGEYLGGSISPGLQMRFNSLHTFTGKLPLIKPEKFDHLNGRNTSESILSGCYRGMLGEIRQTIQDYESQFGSLEIFLTGGDYQFFADALKNRIFADPFLTLKGLNEILLFQNN